jgi:CHASE3 domain sensor protein
LLGAKAKDGHREKVLQRIADSSGSTAIAAEGAKDVLTEIHDELQGTSEQLEKIVNDQDEMIRLLGALLDVTVGDEPE